MILQALKDIAGMMSLRHPNILPVLGASVEPESRAVCMVMAHMEKSTLSDLVHNETVEFDLEAILKIAQEIAAAMGYVHQARPGLVYQTLSPNTLLLDRNNCLYLADFPVSCSQCGCISCNTAIC